MLKQIVSSNELIEILNASCSKMNDIKLKLDKDSLINQGLFLMATTYFEATLRDVMSLILVSYPNKLNNDKFTISKEILSKYNDSEILYEIIENELFNLFKGNVKEQLLYVIEIVSNIKIRNIKSKHKCEDFMELINKCSDISMYRNTLIHNAGMPAKDFSEKIVIYIDYFADGQKINYTNELIIKFIDDYLNFFAMLKEKILKNIDFKAQTKIEQLRALWNQCFHSPLLLFEDYWAIDEKRDLIVDIKYLDYEESLSSSEKVLLSIWRHQYYDTNPTKEFLLCSIDEDILYKIYKILNKVKFNHMYQMAHL